MKKSDYLLEALKERIFDSLSRGESQFPTESEIAKVYQVSRNTVRMALTTLEEEGYLVSRQGSGRQLTGKVPEREGIDVVFLFSRPEEYLYKSLLENMKEHFEKQHYRVEIMASDMDFEKERVQLEKLLQYPPKLLLLQCFATTPTTNADLLQSLETRGTKIFMYQHNYPNLNYPVFKADDFEGSYHLTRHLLENGHQQIAAVFCTDMPRGVYQQYGYLSACRDMEMENEKEHVFHISAKDLSDPLSNQEFVTFLEQRRLDCTAFLFCSDEVAYPASAYIESMGSEIPDDISVVSFDNSRLNWKYEKPISSISFHEGDLGELVIHFLDMGMTEKSMESVTVQWNLGNLGVSDKALKKDSE